MIHVNLFQGSQLPQLFREPSVQLHILTPQDQDNSDIAFGRRSTWSGIVQFALQHAVKVGVNHVSSYQTVRNLALGMIAPDEPKITPP